MDDLGPLRKLLGMKIGTSNSSIHLSQDVYTAKILEKYGMAACKPVLTPMVPNTCLRPATQADMDNFHTLGINYCQAIGLLNYLAVSTQPDT
jgi:hypothetical protein